MKRLPVPYLIPAVAVGILLVVGLITRNLHMMAGALFWGVVAFLLILILPGSRFHQLEIGKAGKKAKIGYGALFIIISLACILPMALNPVYNGENPQWRNQYEVLTERILEGHIDMGYEVDPVLAEMENPYDPAARKEAGATYHWDHAFYNNQYFMYFGVVPVFLLFLPYRVITGSPLTTYHATQVFVLLIILAVFVLFWKLAKRLFATVPYSVVICMAAGISVLSIWYSIGAPALYCTAITGGICLEVWSIFFFIDAIFFSKSEKRLLLEAILGGLCGALAFGCRPSTACANLAVAVLLIPFFRKHGFNKKRVGQVFLILLPYVIVCLGLMYYNKIRFGSPFEFGQAYQITSADQHLYGHGMVRSFREDLVKIVKNFFEFSGWKTTFPFITRYGAMINFPILLSFVLLVWKRTASGLKKRQLLLFTIALLVVSVVITAVDAHWAPRLSERYRMDIYYLLGIAAFLAVTATLSEVRKEHLTKWASVICFFSLLAILTAFFLFLEPRSGEKNLTYCYPKLFEHIKRVLSFGFSLL